MKIKWEHKVVGIIILVFTTFAFMNLLSDKIVGIIWISFGLGMMAQQFSTYMNKKDEETEK